MEHNQNFARLRNCSCQHCSPPSNYSPLQHCSHAFDALVFLLQFLVSSHFILVIAFGFVFFSFFLVIFYTLSTYISLSLYKLCINHFTFGNRHWAAACPLLPPFSIFFHFISPLLAAKHPPIMTTRRMSG